MNFHLERSNYGIDMIIIIHKSIKEKPINYDILSYS